MSDKHSKNENNIKSYFFGLLAIVFLAGIFLLFIYLLGNIIIWFIEWIGNLTNTFDTVIIVTLITAAVSIFSVCMSTIVSKSVDFRKSRKKYLAEKREEPYSQFISINYKILNSTKQNTKYSQEDIIRDMASFSEKLTLWGSKKVVKMWSEYRYKAVHDPNNGESMFVIEDIMNQMRKDLGTKKTKEKELLSFYVNDIHDYEKKPT